MLNQLVKYVTFNINNKLSFMERLRFQSFALDSLVKNLNNDDSKYLS